MILQLEKKIEISAWHEWIKTCMKRKFILPYDRTKRLEEEKRGRKRRKILGKKRERTKKNTWKGLLEKKREKKIIVE